MSEMSLDSQAGQILLALVAGESLSPLDALNRFGCFRLGARIWDLKRRGYQIDTEWETDGKKRWARYRMAKGTQLRMAI